MGGGCRKNIRKRVSKQNKKTAVDQPFRLNMEVFDEFSVLGLTPPTAVEAVAGSIEELMAKKKWYSEQPRGSVPTLKEIRDAERESKKKSVSKSSNGKKSSKKFALSSDDFAPLSDNVASTSTIALNSTVRVPPCSVCRARIGRDGFGPHSGGECLSHYISPAALGNLETLRAVPLVVGAGKEGRRCIR